MGTVYRAEQISLKRKVAVKLLKPEMSADAALVRRFNSEAKLAAKLNHPNTVTLYDFGQDDDGSLFIAMEFVEGESLREVMVRQGPIRVPRAIHICQQICSSISDAHSHGIIHRDLKPDNVMLTSRSKKTDVVRVLDFGIAKLRDGQGDITAMPMTQAGDLLGTPQYMAPEQIRGETIDARTDVYAMGAMVYEIITGRLPFEAPTLMAILSKHLTELPTPPIERRADLKIPPELSALVVAAMAKNPNDRPLSMDAFNEGLEQIGSSLGMDFQSESVNTPNLHPPSSNLGHPMPSIVHAPPGVPRRLVTPVPPSSQTPNYQTPNYHPPNYHPPNYRPPSYQSSEPYPSSTGSIGTEGTAPLDMSLAQAASVSTSTPATPATDPQLLGRQVVTSTPAASSSRVPPRGSLSAGQHPATHLSLAPTSKSRGWIGIILALFVVGGAGAGAFWAMRSQKDDTSIPKNENEASNSNEDRTNTNEENSSGKETKDSEELPSLDDWDITISPSDSAKPNFSERFVHPVIGVEVDHPPNLTQVNGQNGIYLLQGNLDGYGLMIYVIGNVVAELPSLDNQKMAVRTIVNQGGGTVTRERILMIQGEKRLVINYEVRGSERGEAVVFVNQHHVAIIGVSTSPRDFNKTRTFRQKLFSKHVRFH